MIAEVEIENKHQQNDMANKPIQVNENADQSNQEDGSNSEDLEGLTFYPRVRHSTRTTAGRPPVWPPVWFHFEQADLMLETFIEDKGISMSYEDALTKDDAADCLKTMHFQLNYLKILDA